MSYLDKSYLDNEFNTELLDDSENLDELTPMSETEIIEHTADENYKIITNMFENLNDYINVKPYTFPIMQYLDRNNFDKWFSQFIIAGQAIKQTSSITKKNKKHKISQF